jgi:mono/diheme cytochrome c family protein
MTIPATRLALAVALATVVGCGKPKHADAPLRPEQMMKFEDLFRRNCQGCHGVGGNKGVAPPLDDPIFLAIVPADVVRDVIANGRRGTLMPAFARLQGGRLTEAQVDILVNGVLGWAKNHPNENLEDLPSYVADLPSSPKPDVQAGARVFENYCKSCHQIENGGRDFRVTTPDFLALVSDQLLRRIVITGRPDLGTMPSFREHQSGSPLSEQQIADVTAYLSSLRAP